MCHRGQPGRDAAAAGQGAWVGLRRRPRAGPAGEQDGERGDQDGHGRQHGERLGPPRERQAGRLVLVRLGLAARPRHGEQDDEGDERDAFGGGQGGGQHGSAGPGQDPIRGVRERAARPSPAAVSASRTATAATRQAAVLSVGPALADVRDVPGSARMAHPSSRRRCHWGQLTQDRPLWGARRGVRVGDADVVVLPGELDFGLGEVPVRTGTTRFQWLRPGSAHPRHHQVQFLQLNAGDPDGGEQVPLAAPHYRVGAQLSPGAARSGCLPRRRWPRSGSFSLFGATSGHYRTALGR